MAFQGQGNSHGTYNPYLDPSVLLSSPQPVNATASPRNLRIDLGDVEQSSDMDLGFGLVRSPTGPVDLARVTSLSPTSMEDFVGNAHFVPQAGSGSTREILRNPSTGTLEVMNLMQLRQVPSEEMQLTADVRTFTVPRVARGVGTGGDSLDSLLNTPRNTAFPMPANATDGTAHPTLGRTQNARLNAAAAAAAARQEAAAAAARMSLPQNANALEQMMREARQRAHVQAQAQAQVQAQAQAAQAQAQAAQAAQARAQVQATQLQQHLLQPQLLTQMTQLGVVIPQMQVGTVNGIPVNGIPVLLPTAQVPMASPVVPGAVTTLGERISPEGRLAPPLRPQFGYSPQAGSSPYHSPVVSDEEKLLVPGLNPNNSSGKSSRSKAKMERIKGLTDRQIPLEEIVSLKMVDAFARDHHGSKYLQHILRIESQEKVVDEAFQQVSEKVVGLCAHKFGNFVIQKMIERGSEETRTAIVALLRGHIARLSRHLYGCRVVQKLFEHMDEEMNAVLVQELDGHIPEVLICKNGNHVVQMAIKQIPIQHLKFVVDSFRDHVVEFGKNNYGCRVMQNLLTEAKEEEKSELLQAILDNMFALASDDFGNYVIQYVLEREEKAWKQRFVRVIGENLWKLSGGKFSSNVAEKAFLCGDDDDRGFLLKCMLGGTDTRAMKLNRPPLVNMVHDPFGNYVVQKALKAVNRAQRELLIKGIMIYTHDLRRSPYFKHIHAAVKKYQHG